MIVLSSGKVDSPGQAAPSFAASKPSPMENMRRVGYHLGCPVWAKKEWAGELFSAQAKAADYLREYAAVFNAVEGNSTFYSLPPEKTVMKWLADTPPHFRFCFKFPRQISHEKKLRQAEKETAVFLKRLRPLGTRLGPLFLQLPSTFGPASFALIENYLSALPNNFQYALEVRHPRFFDDGACENRLNTLLQELKIDRVIFDGRALHAAASQDPFIREAQKRKPKMPVRFVATGSRPFVRLVADSSFPEMPQHFSAWAQVFAHWLAQGKTPFMFMHAPDDFHAPRLARQFHQVLAQQCPQAGELPPWPAEKKFPNENQLNLF